MHLWNGNLIMSTKIDTMSLSKMHTSAKEGSSRRRAQLRLRSLAGRPNPSEPLRSSGKAPSKRNKREERERPGRWDSPRRRRDEGEGWNGVGSHFRHVRFYGPNKPACLISHVAAHIWRGGVNRALLFSLT